MQLRRSKMSLPSVSGEFWKQKWIEGESSWHKEAVQETLKVCW